MAASHVFLEPQSLKELHEFFKPKVGIGMPLQQPVQKFFMACHSEIPWVPRNGNRIPDRKHYP